LCLAQLCQRRVAPVRQLPIVDSAAFLAFAVRADDTDAGLVAAQDPVFPVFVCIKNYLVHICLRPVDLHSSYDVGPEKSKTFFRRTTTWLAKRTEDCSKATYNNKGSTGVSSLDAGNCRESGHFFCQPRIMNNLDYIIDIFIGFGHFLGKCALTGRHHQDAPIGQFPAD